MKCHHKKIAVFYVISLSVVLGGCNFPYFGNKKSNTPTPQFESVMNNSNPDTTNSNVKGVQVQSLFNQTIKNDKDRLELLEQAVQAMRNEMNTVRPSVDRLVSIEGDIKDLITQLERLANPEPISLRPAEAMEVKTPIANSKSPATKKKTSSLVPPVSTGTPTIYSVRIGEHPGKTRIVLDVSGKTTFSTDLDTNENILVVDLPNAAWSALKSQNFSKSTFLSSFRVEDRQDGNGVMMIGQLKKAAKIGYRDTLAGSNGSSQRFVIDLVQ